MALDVFFAHVLCEYLSVCVGERGCVKLHFHVNPNSINFYVSRVTDYITLFSDKNSNEIRI